MITYNLSVDEKFEKMQQMMFVVYPSLSSFYCMCNKRAVNDKEITLRLNTIEGSAPVIEYDEGFIGKMSVESLTVLISIELFRLLLHHPTCRMQADRGLTVQASNFVCCDSKIVNFVLPTELKKVYPKITDLMTMEPKFNAKEDLFLEKVYAILSKQQQNQSMNQQGQSQAGQGNSGGDGESNDGSNDDNSQPGQNGGSSKSQSEQEQDALGDHFSPKQSQKNAEAWGENDIIDSQVSNEVNKKSLSSWSDVGDGMTKMILKANELQFDPRSVLKRFATSVFSDFISFTRMRPNRRLPGMTGIIPGKRHDMKAKVLFAIDCSGSMSEDEIERACGVVNSSLKHAEVHYCFWDCSCSDFTQKRNKSSDFDGLGGGGTNPDCVIRKIEEEKARFDGLVFITDCYFKWEQPKGKHKIFILHTKDAGEPPEWCKWHLGMDDIEKIASGK